MITWLTADDLGLATTGALGLCRAPGSDSPTRDEDLATLAAARTDDLICLQEAHELRRNEPPETITARRLATEALGISFTHAPIEDFEAPTLPQAQTLTRQCLAALRAGRRVVVHCHAGLGRAGTIAACVLIASRGLSAEGAIAYVRWLRPGAVQSEAQEALIAQFARSV